MKKTLLLPTIGLLTLGILSGVTPAVAKSQEVTIKDVQKEARVFLDTIASYSQAEKDDMKSQIRHQLKKIEKRTTKMEDRIEAKWDKMDSKTRKDIRLKLKQLRERRVKLQEKYEDLRDAGADSWGVLKQGFADAYMDLQESWEALESRIGKQ
jgi:DNA repair exonuclease SbcCD ATPase subunit